MMIPEELKKRSQWVCWRYEKVIGREKPTKVPYDPITGYKAKTTDPASWNSYEDAIKNAYKYDGIGFVFTKEDPYVGIDLDGVLNEKGEFLTKDAKEIFEHCNSYTEISPSGTGIHIIGKAKLSDKAAHKVEANPEKGSCAKEMYDTGRYFTFTGKQLGDIDVIEDISLMAAALEDQYIPQEQELLKERKGRAAVSNSDPLIVYTKEIYPEVAEFKDDSKLAEKASFVQDVIEETEIIQITKSQDLFIRYNRKGRMAEAVIKDEGRGFSIPTDETERMKYIYAKLIRYIDKQNQILKREKAENNKNLKEMHPITQMLVNVIRTDKSSAESQKYFDLRKVAEILKEPPNIIWEELKADMSNVPSMTKSISKIFGQDEEHQVKGILVSRDLGEVFTQDISQQEINHTFPDRQKNTEINRSDFWPKIQESFISTEDKAAFLWLKNRGINTIKVNAADINEKNLKDCVLEDVNLSDMKFTGAVFDSCDIDHLTGNDKTDLSKTIFTKCRFENPEDVKMVVLKGAKLEYCEVHMMDPRVPEQKTWNMINAKNQKIKDERLNKLLIENKHINKKEITNDRQR